MNEIVVKDKFVDFAGKEHYFMVAAIKEIYKNTDANIYSLDNEDGFMAAGLRVGISICNPLDDFDNKIGIIKAKGCAAKNDVSLLTRFPGQLTEEIIQLFVKQKVEHIKAHPDYYIKGYRNAEKRYLKNREIDELEKNLTDKEWELIKEIQNNPNYLDNVNKYLSYHTKCNK